VRISNNSGGSVLFYQGGRHIKRKFAVILRDGYAHAAMADIINRLPAGRSQPCRPIGCLKTV